MKTIEFLYFDGCPSWKIALDSLKDVLKELKISTEIIFTKVETNEEAVLHKFQGSPTIKVDSKDLFPTDQDDSALGCRIYKTAHGFKGAPTRKMIKDKLLALIH